MRKLILSTSWNQECLQQGTPYFFEVRQPKSRGFVMFAKRRMCRKRSFQNWGSQNWSQTNLDQKFKFNSNKNVCLENWKLKENRYKLFDSNFLISYQKKSLGFSLENIPYLIFWQKMVELCPFLNSCFWDPAHCW